MGTGAGRVFLLALVLLFALQTTPASADKKAMHDAMMLPLLSPFCLLPCVIFFSAFPASLNALLATITDDFTILPYDLRAISGVALQIDESFVPLLRQLPGVIAVIPDTLYKPHTTHSWDFLGLASNGGEITPAWSSAKLGVGTIIGVIDTGTKSRRQHSAHWSLCLPGSLDPDKVKGKIVVCVRGVNARVEKGFVVKQAGGVGMVLCNDASTGDTVLADAHVLAAAHCAYSHNPLGYINATDASFGVKPAPKIAAFSSRGPNAITPQILKPDITAPGVNVIAAYSGAVSPTELPFDDRRVAYNIMSGTSMSCPHVSGIVGLLKTKYPSWSPAMIKSAIMTTANTMANDGNPIQDEAGAVATPFGYGSGHVDPVRALDPGLVYDTTLVDYTNFLCSLKPTQTTQDPIPSLPVDLPMMGSLSPPVTSLLLPLFNAAGEPCKCSQGPYGRPEDLNYPSIAVPCLSGSGATVKRRLKNVGGAPSKYKVKVTVAPSELDFVWVGEEKEFTVKLDMDVNAPAAANDYVFGSIVLAPFILAALFMVPDLHGPPPRDVQKWLGHRRRLGGSPKLWLLFLDVKIMGDKKAIEILF
ncbi:unnamed protein product [Miscanthus lutarioriparius]|uniref:Uncharacterized protein n=1 Tax=Miscanthus lutarioriparius TaxID=422564 RepID=A0A811P7G0_9POAL|nr:unnamed protein product [Miscanthus lutarioriparius]